MVAVRKNEQKDIEVGDLLAGKYRVDRVLGKGGMGVVVAATHTDLDETVALKLLHAADSDEAITRFLREAKAPPRSRAITLRE